MGTYNDCVFTVTVPVDQAISLARSLGEHLSEHYPGEKFEGDSFDEALKWLKTHLWAASNEDGLTDEWTLNDDGTLTFEGWGSGKSWDSRRTLYQPLVAAGASALYYWTSTVDPDDRWAIRVHEGKISHHPAVVTTTYAGLEIA